MCCLIAITTLTMIVVVCTMIFSFAASYLKVESGDNSDYAQTLFLLFRTISKLKSSSGDKSLKDFLMDHDDEDQVIPNINLSSEDAGVQDEESDSDQEEDQHALGVLALSS